VPTQASRIEIVVSVTVLALVVIGCFVILRPFLAALSWSLILTITTWPAYHWLEARLGGRRTLAALLMTSVLALAFVLPFALVWPKLAQNIGMLAGEGRALLEDGPPRPPVWLAEIPLLGVRVQGAWREYAADLDALTDQVAVYLPATTAWLLGVLGRLGAGFLELLLSVLATFFFYRDGVAAAHRLRSVVERMAGTRGERLMRVAGETIKGVVYGIIGTAFAQGILIGLGLWLAGVPGHFFLGLVACIVSILPAGAPLIWLPAAIWLFYGGETGWGIFMLAWGALVVGSVDNFLKPYLIGRGSSLPLLLVFLGIFGGAMAFGFLGIFLGPTILAVGQTLLQAWTPEAEQSQDAS
jgi:predicted PurR-regulated permease PerM